MFYLYRTWRGDHYSSPDPNPASCSLKEDNYAHEKEDHSAMEEDGEVRRALLACLRWHCCGCQTANGVVNCGEELSYAAHRHHSFHHCRHHRHRFFLSSKQREKQINSNVTEARRHHHAAFRWHGRGSWHRGTIAFKWSRPVRSGRQTCVDYSSPNQHTFERDH